MSQTLPQNIRPCEMCGKEIQIGKIGTKRFCDSCKDERYREDQRIRYLSRRADILKKIFCKRCADEIKPEFGRTRSEICKKCQGLILQKYYLVKSSKCIYCNKPCGRYFCSRGCLQKTRFLRIGGRSKKLRGTK